MSQKAKIIDSSKLINVDNFKIDMLIGNGAFGQVYLVTKIETGEKYAAKVSQIDIKNIDSDDKYDLLREININACLNHPSILKFIGYSLTDFDHQNKLVIFSKYIPNGSLRNFINDENCGLSSVNWSMTKKLIIIYGIASGMQFLHSHDIIHRDLKPENILIDENLYPKIADFGFSKSLNEKQSTGTFKGTIQYASIETLKFLIYSKKGDVYSFSFIVYEIMTGTNPFHQFKRITLWKNALEGWRPNLDVTIPDSYKLLIKRCWNDNPDERPTFDDIVKSLRNDRGFITDEIDEGEYIKYIDYIDNYNKSFDETGIPLTFTDFQNIDRKSMEYFYESLVTSQNSNKDDHNSPKTNPNSNKDDNDSPKTILNSNKDDNDPPKTILNSNKDDNDSQKINHNSDKNDLSSPSPRKNPSLVKVNTFMTRFRTPNSLMRSRLAPCKPIKILDIDSYSSYYSYSDYSDDHHDESINDTTHENPINSDDNKQTESKEEPKTDENQIDENNIQLKAAKTELNFSIQPKNENLNFRNSYTSIPTKQIIKIREKLNSSMYCKKNDSISFPADEFDQLSLDCQELVLKAECDPQLQYYVATYLIEGNNGFPKKPHLGIQYLKHSINGNCVDSIILYCKILTKTEEEIIPHDVKKAKQLLRKKLKLDDSRIYLFYARIKMNENSISKAKKYFQLASNLGNDEAQYELGLIYLNEKMIDKAIEFFKMAKSNGNTEKDVLLLCNIVDKLHSIIGFLDLPIETKNLFVSKVFDYYKNADFNPESSPKQVPIIINYQNTSILYKNKTLEDPSFDNILDYFEKFSIQLKFPSKKYSNVYRIISEKKMNKKPNLQVIIVITNMKEIKEKFGPDDIINKVIIDSLAQSIETDQNSTSSSEKINGCFSECHSLTEVIIPSSLFIIGKWTFACSALVQITIPFLVTKIEERCFSCCKSLNKITIPLSVKSIEERAFYGCSSLIQITIPSSVVFLGDGCFEECSSIEKIEHNSNLISIGEKAFFNCSSLKEFTIPPSIKTIGNLVFTGCNSIQSISIPHKLEDLVNDIGISNSKIVKYI